jgi:hypothetical protein
VLTRKTGYDMIIAQNKEEPIACSHLKLFELGLIHDHFEKNVLL